jgi:hypothetical protein
MLVPLSSKLSNSLSSIRSNSLLASNISASRIQTSLHSILITNQLHQFSQFLHSQTSMFKMDSLINQININQNQSNPFVEKDLTNTGLTSSLLSQSASTSSLTSLTSKQTQQLQLNNSSDNNSIASQNSPTLVSKGSFSSNSFNLFGFMRKSSKSESVSNSTPLNQQQKLKQQRTDHKIITQYIKSFESIVIKSLRQYTFTTSVNLQTRILELLSQLIFLKVDYCLLDSDKVFIEYVLKQFDYLEQKRVTDSSHTKNNNIYAIYKSNSSLALNYFYNLSEENGSNSLSNSYSIDLYESFDCETMFSDPLNPLDIDTMINKLHVKLNNAHSTSFGASGIAFRQNTSGGVSNFGSSSYSSAVSNTPIISNLNLKQQEHQRNHMLIPKLFDFLILLSHEKRSQTQIQTNIQNTFKNSKLLHKSNNGLLTIPEIMQLCENLIASENSPHTHAIPALRPLVIDLFLNRINEDTKELDIQHDVIMNSLLRLIQYPQIWPLLTIVVLRYKKGIKIIFIFKKFNKLKLSIIYPNTKIKKIYLLIEKR